MESVSDPPSDTAIMSLGSRIAKARRAKMFDRNMLASKIFGEHRVRYGANVIGEWERNDTEPSTPMIRRLAVALGVSTDWLLGIESVEP